MKADLGCVWPGEKPPGPYSTSTPLMLLPGTLGSSCWKTRVTLATFSFGACASAPANGRIATSKEQAMRFMESSSDGGPRAAQPFVETDVAQLRLACRR